jgi:hypothetical protein
MARVASFVRRNAMVLEVGCCKIMRIVDGETSSVRLHDVARETEGHLLRTLHVFRKPSRTAEKRKKKKRDEGEDLSFARRRQRRTCEEHDNQNKVQQEDEYRN